VFAVDDQDFNGVQAYVSKIKMQTLLSAAEALQCQVELIRFVGGWVTNWVVDYYLLTLFRQPIFQELRRYSMIGG